MIKRNVLANLLGQGWAVLFTIVLIPLYIRYLGVEAYGVIGVYAVMEALLAVLDAGMAPAMSREMARFTGGAHDAMSIRRTLRTGECLVMACGLAVSGTVILSANWILTGWLKPDGLIESPTISVVRLMALCLACRLMEALYRSSMLGLQRQVLGNAISSALVTCRGLGSIVVIIWISPTLEAFFACQAAFGLVGVIALATATYTCLPGVGGRVRASFAVLRRMWGFAGAMLALSALGLIWTQTDRIVLSHLLDLRDYGCYMIAANAASGIGLAFVPVVQALLPRLTQLHTGSDDCGFRYQFHLGAQWVAALSAGGGAFIILHADRILWAWTGDAALAQSITPIFQLLVAGNVLSAVAAIPVNAQLAIGWTRRVVQAYGVGAALTVPAIVIAADRLGAVGSALAWCALNAGFACLAVPLMFTGCLGGERGRWCRTDTVLPMATATSFAVTLWIVSPSAEGDRMWTALSLLLGGSVCVLLTLLATPGPRTALSGVVRSALTRSRRGT